MMRYVYILGGVLVLVLLGFFLIPQDPHADLIRVTSPYANEIVTSPLTITGEARGTWYFEASFPVKLLDGNGNLVTQFYASALSDWMTQDFVPFEATLQFENPKTPTGTLVLEKDNPSGLPEHADEIHIPVRFNQGALSACRRTGCSSQICSDKEMVTTCEYREEYACYKTAKCERQSTGECGWTPTQELTSCLASNQELMTVKAFFGSTQFVGTSQDCTGVLEVTRTVPKTDAVARASLIELLNGLTESDIQKGFFTSIPKNVVIQSLTIQNGIARVDFSKELEQGVAGSCKVGAIRSQIESTLKQFSTVQNVVISINGRTQDILQP